MRSAPAAAAARTVFERIGAVERVAVEEVLGVEQHALSLRHEEGDRVADHREVLLWRGAHDLLHVQKRGLADQGAGGREAVGEHAQPLVLLGAALAAAGHAEGDDLGGVELLLGEQLEQLALLGVRGGEAGLDHVDAQGIERVHHAQLLLRGERHAAAAHAVAQGGVVELDGRHQPAGVGAPGGEAGPAACAWAAPFEAPETSPVGVSRAAPPTTSSHSR